MERTRYKNYRDLHDNYAALQKSHNVIVGDDYNHYQCRLCWSEWWSYESDPEVVIAYVQNGDADAH
jgi:hypothetical protein